jgi:hypothetical protein
MTRRFILGCSVLAIVAGCATERPTRSFVQPNYVDKSVFTGEWYMRATITDVPPTTSVSFAGESSQLEKIRWEIQEQFLVAYRSYELIPGSTQQADPNKAPDATRTATGQTTGRSDGFTEAPIAAYPIVKQFDIFRQYNTTTGEEINVLEENDKDNPWYARKYIRVDWSKNQVVNFTMLSPLTGQWYVQDSEGGRDKFRIAYRKDTQQKDQAYYFDFVTKLFVDPDLYGCILTMYNLAAEDCTSAELSVRTSFLKVDPPREFEPIPYDDMKLGKFGYFRTERLTYNRQRGITQSGRIFLANIHNIFQKSLLRDTAGNAMYMDSTGKQVFYSDANGFYYADASGQPQRDGQGNIVNPDGVKPVYLPKEARPLKPVVYHLSPRYPLEMVRAAEHVAESWNAALRRAAAAAQNRNLDDGSFISLQSCEAKHGQGQCKQTSNGGFCSSASPCEDIPDMFQLNYNGWVKTVDGKDFTDYQQNRDKNHYDGRPLSWKYNDTFEVFQTGDLRFSTIYWVQPFQVSGPLGFGPSASDPETGEVISGTAYVYGGALDTYATTALDIIKVLNGKLSMSDLESGANVQAYIQANLDHTDPRQRIGSALLNLPAKEAMKQMLGDKRIAMLNAVKQVGLQPVQEGHDDAVMQKIQAAGFDQLLINEEIRIAKSGSLYQPNSALTPEEKAVINFASWGTPQKLLNSIRSKIDKAMRANLTLAEFADDAVQGLATEYAQRNFTDADFADGGKVWQELRERIFRAVTEHEVGHTLGLRHNFQGSFDSVNYGDGYWDLRKENLQDFTYTSEQVSLSQVLDSTTPTPAQITGKQHQYMYSSIMDYGSRFNSDIQGIGKYDMAAILFAYGNAVEVFDWDRNSVDRTTQYYFDQSSNRPAPVYPGVPEYFHYTQIPVRLGNKDIDQGVAKLRQRRIVNWDSLQAQYPYSNNLVGTSAPLEVPYMFCGDEYVNALGSCFQWDAGADQREIGDDLISRYKNYYFFNNYKRDRHPYDASMVLQRVFSRYLAYLPMLYQQWVLEYLYGNTVDGIGDVLWQIGTLNGLNLLGDILARPSYGTFCQFQGDTTISLWDYSMDSDCTDPNNPSRVAVARATIPVGLGRRTYSRYDWTSGYNLFDRTLEVGHFWDYIGAMFALVQTDAIVLGREVASDFNRYIIPYYLAFPDETTRIVNGLFARDYQAISPRIDPNTGAYLPYPLFDLSGTNAAPGGVPINLDLNFTFQIYSMLYPMAFFTSSYSLHFPDQAEVFRVGEGEAPTPGDGYQLLSFTDPMTGHQYGTFMKTDGSTNTLAAKMIQQGSTMAARWLDLKSQGADTLPSTDTRATEFTNLGFELNDLVQNLNILRSMYQTFGRNF